MRKKKKFIIMAGALCTAVIVSLGVSKELGVQALFDEASAVHIDASEIKEGTLLIGTHLIHISAVSDEIYEIADSSASESGQMNRYYKSELADGEWFNITDAASLKDITTEGTPVPDTEVEELFLTHHTKSNGITYDLVTGKSVCIFDIAKPYDLENLKELEPLKLQYDILADKKDKSKTDEFCEKEIREFFLTEVKDKETDRLDSQLKALQSAYRKGEKEKRSVIAQTMEAVDASRRVLVLEKIKEPLNQLIQHLQGKDVNIEDGEAQENHFEINADLNSGASDSVQNVEESILEYSSKMLSKGTTTLSKEEYKVKITLIEAAEDGDKEALKKITEKALLLNNIIKDVIGNAKKEQAYLDESLLPDAKAAYFAYVTGGEGKDYKAAAARSNSSDGVLKEALQTRMNKAEAARSELQFLVNATVKRMSSKDGADFLKGIVSEADRTKEKIKNDAFSAYANASMESYLNYLDNLAVNGSLTENEKSFSKLLKQKEKRQEEKLAALDANDLEGAKKAEAELEILNDKINALEKKMSESDETGISDEADTKTALQSAKKIAKGAIATIQTGSTAGVPEAIDGLGAFMSVNPEAALDGLQDVYQALSTKAYLEGAEKEGSKRSEDKEKISGYESCMTQIEEVLADNRTALNNTTLSEEEAQEILEQTAGKPMEEQSQEEQAALLEASLAALEQQANEGIKKMAQTLAAQMEANGSPYIFRQYNDPVNEYIPAKTIAECMGYRYIFDNNQQKVTISKKGEYFTFRAFQSEYEKGKDKQELSVNAGFQADIYLSEQDTKELFKCTAQYVPGSELALLNTGDNRDQASAYLSMLLTRVGG